MQNGSFEAPGTILGVVEDGIEVATGSGCVCPEVAAANRPECGVETTLMAIM